MRAKSYDTNAPQGRNPVCIVPTRNFTLFWFSRQWQVAIGNAVTRLALRHQWQHCVGGAAAVLLLCAGYQCCVGGVVQMTRCPVPVVFNDQFWWGWNVYGHTAEAWRLKPLHRQLCCVAGLNNGGRSSLKLWMALQEWNWDSLDLPRTKVGMDQNKRNNANVSKRNKNIR